ncbi:hypothetical protein [Rubrimonas cliftonensis]|uniref:Uncharacterized protein n=1 Tax=Rubrimonas cliftonensis TaxID=89524 RepID=A0A1H3XDY0_9RHOB|nr:hypothetical protein [Rubrimonas cliftonensis]SDZ97161.1 hypothetical protein SAMN05444370_102369 [Rubrimonas cliftonensis]
MFRDISRRPDDALAGLGAGLFGPRGFARPFCAAEDMRLGGLETHHHVEANLHFRAFAEAAPELKLGFEVPTATMKRWTTPSRRWPRRESR